MKESVCFDIGRKALEAERLGLSLGVPAPGDEPLPVTKDLICLKYEPAPYDRVFNGPSGVLPLRVALSS
jgi:hypothetical protein